MRTPKTDFMFEISVKKNMSNDKKKRLAKIYSVNRKILNDSSRINFLF